jgi:hypothetical protein
MNSKIVISPVHLRKIYIDVEGCFVYHRFRKAKKLIEEGITRALIITGGDVESTVDHAQTVAQVIGSPNLEEVVISVNGGNWVKIPIINALKKCTSLKRLTLRFRSFVDLYVSFEGLAACLPNLEYLELESMNFLGHVSKYEDPSKFVETNGITFGVDNGTVRLFDKRYRDIFYESLKKFRHVKEIKLIRFYMNPVEVSYLDGVENLTLDDRPGEFLNFAIGNISTTTQNKPLEERIKRCIRTIRTPSGYALHAATESDTDVMRPTYRFANHKTLNFWMYGSFDCDFTGCEHFAGLITRTNLITGRYSSDFTF